MIAIVVVRAGVAEDGWLDALHEADGNVLLVGGGVADAAGQVAPYASRLSGVALREGGPATWAAAIAPLVEDHEVVLVSGGFDGRLLGPYLAHTLGRPFIAQALEVTTAGAVVPALGGTAQRQLHVAGNFVASIQPGVVGSPAPAAGGPAVLELLEVTATEHRELTSLGVTEADATTIDLAEASRIVAGGAGLGGADAFEALARLGAHLGASMGATRVVADRGDVDFSRQIGTTGVAVDPALYVAFGISGAIQHTAGLGHPDHIISVNLDPSCPMMQMADLAIEADASATMAALLELLEEDRG